LVSGASQRPSPAQGSPIDGHLAAGSARDSVVKLVRGAQVTQAFGPTGGPKYILDFDVNRDGKINSGDMLIQAKVFGPC